MLKIEASIRLQKIIGSLAKETYVLASHPSVVNRCQILGCVICAAPGLIEPIITGSKENEDSGVPHIEIPASLQAAYAKLHQQEPSKPEMLKFMRLLWTYFNQHFFASHMDMPELGVMRNVAAQALRVRGRWVPSKNALEISPRLFNAGLPFFAEVFLHEQCHQAVTQIDKADTDPSELKTKGHGNYWVKWMRKVGLNPNRFDPKDNEGYKNDKDKAIEKTIADDDEAIARKIAELSQGTQKVTSVSTGMPVTVIGYDAKKKAYYKYDGVIAGKALKNGKVLAVVPLPLPASVSEWKEVRGRDMYVYKGAGPKDYYPVPEFEPIMDTVRQHYRKKGV